MSELSVEDAIKEVSDGASLERIREIANSFSIDLGANITQTVLYSGD